MSARTIKPWHTPHRQHTHGGDHDGQCEATFEKMFLLWFWFETICRKGSRVERRCARWLDEIIHIAFITRPIKRFVSEIQSCFAQFTVQAQQAWMSVSMRSLLIYEVAVLCRATRGLSEQISLWVASRALMLWPYSLAYSFHTKRYHEIHTHRIRCAFHPTNRARSTMQISRFDFQPKERTTTKHKAKPNETNNETHNASSTHCTRGVLLSTDI